MALSALPHSQAEKSNGIIWFRVTYIFVAEGADPAHECNPYIFIFFLQKGNKVSFLPQVTKDS